MKIAFKRTFEQAKFLDPFNDFKEKVISIEIREDPITGLISRILKFRFKLPESPEIKETFRATSKECPFCQENLDKVTPKFTREIFPEGRITAGESTLLPNAFPYSKYNSVVVLSKEHFIGIDKFTVTMLKNGFRSAQKYIKRILDLDPDVKHYSVNWNYMPPAGGGLIHPHLQIVADVSPTYIQRILYERSKNYYQNNSSILWKDFLSQEKKSNQRYIGTIGSVSFLSAFAPSGMLGEIIAVFEGKNSITDLSEGDLNDFSEGLVKIFRYFGTKNIYSFNLGVYSIRTGQDYLWVNSRIIPRVSLPPLNISDINYFEKLHKEVISTVLPEEMCDEIREYL